MIKVKKAQFFYGSETVPSFQKTFNQINGYGNLELNFNNRVIYGSIQDPFGWVPAVFYTTGVLTGHITDNIGSFTWENITLEGTGAQNRVYLNYATGYKQATGMIEIDAFYRTKLNHLDLISINSVGFNFVTGVPQNLFEFNTIERFINVLNSGSQGLLDNPTLENAVGVSGSIDYTYPYHKIYLTSVSNSGDDGNNNVLFRDCNDLDVIRIKNRYFQGGQTFRTLLNSWIGTFSNNFETLTYENTGFYNQKIASVSAGIVQDVAWEDNFNQNYYITTGIRNPVSQEVFSGSLLPFDINRNKYYASIVIPSGSSLYIYTGFVFNIFKPNPYNIQGNLAKYIVSGNNFVFSGIIEG